MEADDALNRLHFIMLALQQAKSALENFIWIKVSDQIPDDNERYLCFDGTIYIANIAWENDEGCKVWISHDGWECNPTHWMKLPIPPK